MRLSSEHAPPPCTRKYNAATVHISLYSSPSWFQKYLPTRQRSMLDTSKNRTIGTAARRVNRPRQQRPADQLRRGDRRRPHDPRAITLLVDIIGEHPDAAHRLAGRGEAAEGIAQRLRHQRQPDHDAQERLRHRGKRLVERAELGKDERNRWVRYESLRLPQCRRDRIL